MIKVGILLFTVILLIPVTVYGHLNDMLEIPHKECDYLQKCLPITVIIVIVLVMGVVIWFVYKGPGSI